MDPLQTLNDVADALRPGGDPERAAELLDAYAKWRGVGGFEPRVSGDEFTYVCRRLLALRR